MWGFVVCRNEQILLPTLFVQTNPLVWERRGPQYKREKMIAGHFRRIFLKASDAWIHFRAIEKSVVADMCFVMHHILSYVSHCPKFFFSENSAKTVLLNNSTPATGCVTEGLKQSLSLWKLLKLICFVLHPILSYVSHSLTKVFCLTG